MPFVAKKLDGIWAEKRMALDEPSFHFIQLLFCVSACPLLPQSSRSQGTAPRHREHREVVPISNEACSCDSSAISSSI